MKNDRNNIPAAFKVLIEEVDREIDWAKRSATNALAADNLDAATAAISSVGQLRSFRDEIENLSAKWRSLPSSGGEHRVPAVVHPKNRSRAQRRNLGRIPAGTKTPEHSYYRPILQALAKLGGRGRVSDVLDRVEAMLGSSFKPEDLQPRRSHPDEVRWRNDAQWARLKMVEQGLLKRGSPHGTWEITELGMRFLESQR